MRITVDINTDASGFGYVVAGPQRLRVVKCEQMEGKKFPYLKWEFELADANVQTTDGKGKPGHVFENTTLKSGDNAQFRLRQVSDALGLEWGELDTETVRGMECDTILKVKEYQGTFSNEVDKFIPVS